MGPKPSKIGPVLLGIAVSMQIAEILVESKQDAMDNRARLVDCLAASMTKRATWSSASLSKRSFNTSHSRLTSAGREYMIELEIPSGLDQQ